MFNKCMELHVDNKWLMQNCFVLAAVTGGYSKNHCENSLKCILESKYFSSVGGILINGLQANGPFNENLCNDDFYKIIEYVISNSPPSLLRSVSGSFPPIIIMKLISLGIDVFDTSYANNATERNCALTFSFEPKNQNGNEAE
ncbi:queuine tRNA-ribosyltransferase accessory subunit 2-like [Ctenocephalides felis]|nr:queuine tRNA-ribosyltransferase accessory subunit 2-like [Ctenocephalides felis]